MFINGDTKYEDILLSAKQLGAKESLIELFKYYDYQANAHSIRSKITLSVYKFKLEEVRSAILLENNREQIDKLINYLDSRPSTEPKRKTKALMKEQGYIDTNLTNMASLRKASSYAEYEAAVQKIIESGSFYDIYNTGKSGINRHPKLAVLLLEEASKLTQDNEIKADIFLNIAIQKKRHSERLRKRIRDYRFRINREDDQKTKDALTGYMNKASEELKLVSKSEISKAYEKAAELGSIKAIEELHHIYGHAIYVLNKLEYVDAYNRLRETMKQSHDGLKHYIIRDDNAQYKDYIALAKYEDIDDLTFFVGQYLGTDTSYVRPEVEALGKRWLDAALKSNDYQIYSMLEKYLSDHYYDSEKADQVRATLAAKSATLENILIYRSEVDKAKKISKKIALLEKLASYGDIQSHHNLAKKHIDNWYSEADRKVDIFSKGLPPYEQQANTYRKQYKDLFYNAVNEYEKLAKQGDVQAWLELGNIHFNKKYAIVDAYNPEVAVEYYEKALSTGSLEAAEKLERIYGCKSCDFQDYDEVSRVLDTISHIWKVDKSNIKLN